MMPNPHFRRMQERVATRGAGSIRGADDASRSPRSTSDARCSSGSRRGRETRKTIIYVTHNVAEAVYLADRVIVMTPHPGTVKTAIDITLPRPRDPLSVEFLEYQKQLLNHLGQAAKAT